jgi:hypothetical protein
VGVGCSGGVSGARALPLIKRWAATARATPRGFAINAGAEAQAPSRRSAASTRASAPALMPLRVPASRAGVSVKSHLFHCHAGPWCLREDTRVVR